MSILHFSMTGYYAGRPYCDVNKTEAKARGDRFEHLGYGKVAERQLTDPDLCAECKREYDEAE